MAYDPQPAMGMRDINPSTFIVEDDPRVSRPGGVIVALDRTRYSTIFICSLFSTRNCLTVRPAWSWTVRMPGRSGLELQRELYAANGHLPIIFITAHGDIPMTVRPTKAGAIEFLTKPIRDQGLLAAIEAGLARDRACRESEKAPQALASRAQPNGGQARTGSGEAATPVMRLPI
jgi:DNA-binding NtrC family response regulator